jgi:RNA polymerase sigma-B factor
MVQTAAAPTHLNLARARGGDERARERVVRQLLPQAERVAARFGGFQQSAEDLTQVALIGLLKAIERFDPTREASFVAYAHALMTGEVRRYVRDTRLVRVPRPIYERVPAFQRALDELRVELQREPSREEIAAALGVTKEDVIEIADAAYSSQPISLDAATEETGGELGIGDVDSDFARVEASATLEPMLRRLTPRERMVIDLRFEEGLSQVEIARGLGLSQTQVSRLIHGALRKLSERGAAGLLQA